MTKQKSNAKRHNKNPFTIAVRSYNEHELTEQTAKVQLESQSKGEHLHQVFVLVYVAERECDFVDRNNNRDALNLHN